MWNTIKNIFYWIALPFGAMAAVIYYLVNKETILQQQIEAAKRDSQIKDTQAKLKEATNDANKAETDYESVRAAYLAEHGKNGDKL